MAKRPVSAVGNKRPISEYARKAALMGGNPRYKMENIIQIELDMPNRTTRDYEGPTVAPRIQAALDAALKIPISTSQPAHESNPITHATLHPNPKETSYQQQRDIVQREHLH